MRLKKNINEDSERKILFPNGDIFTINGINDFHNIRILRDMFFEIIDNCSFEILSKTKWYYISHYYFLTCLNKTEIPAEHIKDIDFEKIIISVKMKLKENRYTMNEKMFFDIVNQYTCDFLSLDYSVIDKLQDIQSNISETEIELNNNKKTKDTKLKEGKKEEKTTVLLKTNIPLFGNVCIFKGFNNILYAEPKQGKTYFSIEVAKSELIKNPLFITLDDISGKQYSRYAVNLDTKNYKIFALNDFDNEYNTEFNKMKNKAEFETVKDMTIPFHNRVKYYIRKNYVEMGLIKKETDKLNKVAVFIKIVKEAVENGHDLICLDCLTSILEGKGHNLDRDKIREILKPFSNKEVTFLLIHHTLKQNQTMALTNELRYTFDNIYKLVEKKRNEDGSTELELIEENARNNTPHIVTIKRTIDDNEKVTHTVLGSDVYQPNHDNNNKKPNMKNLIIDVIKNNDGEEIQYKDLILQLERKTGKKNDESNIMKWLKELGDDTGIVKMKDNSTWKGGILIDKSQL